MEQTTTVDAPVEETANVKVTLDRSQMADFAKTTGLALALTRSIDDALVILKHGLGGTRQMLRNDAEHAVRALMAQDRTYAIRLRRQYQEEGVDKITPEQPPVSPEIVTVTGDLAKHGKEVQEVAERFTLDGKIVFGPQLVAERDAKTHNTKARTVAEDGELRKRKIEISDSLYVVNPKGKVDLATAREIVYAKALKRAVLSLEPLDLVAIVKQVNDAAE